MAKTIGEMTVEVRAINIEKGWRPAEGGPGTNTLGDYVSLAISEISETLEAFRDHGLADATEDVVEFYNGPEPGTPTREVVTPGKPEGVGSEMADVLIRLLDMCDVFGVKAFDPDMELGDVADLAWAPTPRPVSFGDYLTWITGYLYGMWQDRLLLAPVALRALVTTCRKFGIDLDAEYARKVAFNRTRPYQHGGRTLAARKETKDA